MTLCAGLALAIPDLTNKGKSYTNWIWIIIIILSNSTTLNLFQSGYENIAKILGESKADVEVKDEPLGEKLLFYSAELGIKNISH